MRLATLAALVLASAALAAEEKPAVTPAPGNTHLAAAMRLYQKLDLDAALAELKEAEVAAKDNEEETVQVFVYRGLILSDTGETAKATDMFKRALAIRPWAEVPPDTSPRIAKTFSDARKSLWGTASNIKPPQKKQRAAAAPAPEPKAAPAAAPAPVPAPAPEAKPPK
jgi:tetratricopeptide (TPR) repeat protein